MQISARNQLVGIVQSIKEGGVVAEVVVKLSGGEEIVSVVTNDSVHRLNIAVGSEVKIIIKSTEVMLAVD